MNSAFKMMNSALKMMNSALKMMNSALKMMNSDSFFFARNTATFWWRFREFYFEMKILQ